jgi:hypothetical protein
MTMIDMIQPGWEVVDSEGESLGQVTRLEGDEVIVKKSSLLGGEYRFQRSSVEDVETGRVALAMSRQQLEASRG